ncbi:MAG: acyltransferase [Candidatus Thorarchaeota archaeon]|nr:acyltransferase [Candidatus Thorarchaeota archaeon]
MTRIGIGQIEPRIMDIDHNLQQLKDILRQATKAEVEVLVLPELANSGYAFDTMEEVEESAESIPKGAYSKQLIRWSRNGRMVVAGINEKFDEQYFNSAGIFAEGNLLDIYRKVHLFNKEKQWFSPGPIEPPVVEFLGHKFGVMICWDWAFPEMARILALKGARMILHPANLVLKYCQRAMETRALENGVFTATANRIGNERKLTFSGKSQITNTKGKVLLSIPDEETGVSYVDIDLPIADRKKLTKMNHLLKDRRPDIYRRLIES